MENNLKFNSAICTSRSQSERLLSLGLKKETADMVYTYEREEHGDSYYWNLEVLEGPWNSYIWPSNGTFIPAWSLHRLIELAYGNWKEDIVPIYLGNSYDMLIGRIEFQVKQGKFNKEYLNGND